MLLLLWVIHVLSLSCWKQLVVDVWWFEYMLLLSILSPGYCIKSKLIALRSGIEQILYCTIAFSMSGSPFQLSIYGGSISRKWVFLTILDYKFNNSQVSTDFSTDFSTIIFTSSTGQRLSLVTPRSSPPSACSWLRSRLRGPGGRGKAVPGRRPGPQHVVLTNQHVFQAQFCFKTGSLYQIWEPKLVITFLFPHTCFPVLKLCARKKRRRV